MDKPLTPGPCLQLLSTVVGVLFYLALASPAQSAGGGALFFNSRIGQATLVLETVITPAQRYRGLSGRQALKPGTGMLFIYPSPAQRAMVMRDMKFALDFLWVAGGVVIGTHQQIPAPGAGRKPQVVRSPGPVDMVVEVPAGWVRSMGVKTGDRFQLLGETDPAR